MNFKIHIFPLRIIQANANAKKFQNCYYLANSLQI